jgi:type IV pilus assembly protein PilA
VAHANSARRNKISRSDSGFTLVELLITIVIMAVIAGISLPSIIQAAVSQRDDSAQAAAKQIALAESSVFSLQRSYVDLTSLQSRKLANAITNSTVLLGPINECYTAVSVSKNGVAFIAESGVASVQLTTAVVSTCASETALQGAVISLGGSTTGRLNVTAVSSVSSISYAAGGLIWPVVSGATYLVERLDAGTWTNVQQSAALTFIAPLPVTGVSVRYRITAVIGAVSSVAKQFVLTNDVPNNIITSGDLSSSSLGWVLASGAYYSNMTAASLGYIYLGTSSTATQVVAVTAPSPVLQLTGLFSSTAGITVRFDFFASGADPSSATPISTVTLTGDQLVAGNSLTLPATAAQIKITVTNTSSTSSNFQRITLQ